MNITTPTAVLISGILIALAVLLKDTTPKPKYHLSQTKGASRYGVLVRTNIETGETCQKGNSVTIDRWVCDLK